MVFTFLKSTFFLYFGDCMNTNLCETYPELKPTSTQSSGVFFVRYVFLRKGSQSQTIHKPANDQNDVAIDNGSIYNRNSSKR